MTSLGFVSTASGPSSARVERYCSQTMPPRPVRTSTRRAPLHFDREETGDIFFVDLLLFRTYHTFASTSTKSDPSPGHHLTKTSRYPSCHSYPRRRRTLSQWTCQGIVSKKKKKKKREDGIRERPDGGPGRQAHATPVRTWFSSSMHTDPPNKYDTMTNER